MDTARPAVGCLRRPVDFQRVLSTPPRARSPLFAVHYLNGVPAPATRHAAAAELSTGTDPQAGRPVEESVAAGRCWLGLVVPKRHARRAVTRTMLKRQMRVAVRAAAAGLPPGMWVLRLRAPVDPRRFISADSPALRALARHELGSLMRQAAARR